MVLLLNCSIIILLFYIAYQDFKYRAIPWIVFPVLALAIIFSNQNFFESITKYLLNFFFIIIQLAVITFYLIIKEKSLVKIWRRHIGLGDILFFGILCLMFSPMNFIFFYVLSLVFTIIVVVSIKLFNSEFSEVPLAGLQAILLALFIIINSTGSKANFFDDYWILSIIDGRSG